jgi:hypothetical protein
LKKQGYSTSFFLYLNYKSNLFPREYQGSSPSFDKGFRLKGAIYGVISSVLFITAIYPVFCKYLSHTFFCADLYGEEVFESD